MVLFFPALGAGTLFGQPVVGLAAPVGVSVLFGAFIFGIGMQLGGTDLAAAEQDPPGPQCSRRHPEPQYGRLLREHRYLIDDDFRKDIRNTSNTNAPASVVTVGPAFCAAVTIRG